MNTPWEQGIANQGPLLPYGGGKSEWEYQVREHAIVIVASEEI
jgi:hypothetical protein